jgi:hypothetical protein
MVRSSRLLFLLLCASSPLLGQQDSAAAPAAKPPQEHRAVAPDSPENLPVRRVVLYKNGVGYFEHLGRVSGSQEVHIDFTSAQLNDVLKSLTVLDLSGGRITGVDSSRIWKTAKKISAASLRTKPVYAKT